jgi:hypothetical protein
MNADIGLEEPEEDATMWRLWLGLAAIAVWTGCVPTPGTWTDSTGSSSGGTGGRGTTSSSSGGGGGGVKQDASETVSAGIVAKNAQYRMVFTVGQPARAQRTLENAGYRLEGGLVGATETTP